jgi:signal transduction histidine kinase
VAIRQFGAGTDLNRLRLLLGLFFVALALPALVLIRQAFDQLELDTFRRHQLLAEEFTQRIDQNVAVAVRSEDARSFADYSFLIVSGDPAANFLQPSPLSRFPVDGAVPGLLGYFQVDADGEFSTPLLPNDDVDPAAYGITSVERAARATAADEIRSILAGNRVGRADLSANASGGAPRLAVSQLSLDELLTSADANDLVRRQAAAPAASTGVVAGESAAERSSTERAFAANDLDAASPREKRLEQTVTPEPKTLRITTFESEVDPLQFNRVESGHLVMFRNVWRDDRRYIQGAVIDTGAFVRGAIGSVFAGTGLSADAGLALRYRGDEFAYLPARGAATARVPGASTAGGSRDVSVLYQTRLSPPLADLELALLVGDLPPGPGYRLLLWVSVVLGGVLLAGFFVMYRFGHRQIMLTRQQRDFVSAVSHELKTPLTSIRMYGEMLQAGWADESKKRTYYTYIYEESERLSRLIENVLQLARMNRGNGGVALTEIGVGELLDMVRSKVATQLERANFKMTQAAEPGIEALTIRADADAFAQIFINLVDNAIKFSSGADRKEIEISARRQRSNVVFGVRDFGPGVRRPEMKKLFELFYRPADELTRSTVGTGIGLGLVKQLATAMHADVDVRNCTPGAEFRLTFPTIGRV